MLDAISGPWVYTGPFGTGAQMKYIANLLLAVHTVAAAEAMALARRSGLDLELVQKTLDNSIASSAIWKQRGPRDGRTRLVSRPRPGQTLHPILEQIEDYAAQTGLPAPVFAAAKEVFDKALADGWGDLDIACVHDQVSGVSALGEHDDLVASQLYRRGGRGFRGAARGRRARRADGAQALVEHAGAARGLARRRGRAAGPQPGRGAADRPTTPCSRRCGGRAR